MAIELYHRPNRTTFAHKLTSFDLNFPNGNQVLIECGHLENHTDDNQTRLEINSHFSSGYQPILSVDANSNATRVSEVNYGEIIYDRAEQSFYEENNLIRFTPDNARELEAINSPHQFQFHPKGSIRIVAPWGNQEFNAYLELDPSNGEFFYHDDIDGIRIYVNPDGNINYRYSSSSFVVAGDNRSTLLGFPKLDRQMLMERSSDGYLGLALAPNDVALDIRQVRPTGLLEYFNWHNDESLLKRLIVDRDTSTHDSINRKQIGRVWGFENDRYHFQDNSSETQTTCISGEMNCVDGFMGAALQWVDNRVFTIESRIYPQNK